MDTHSHSTSSKKPPAPVFIAAVVFLFFCTFSVADSIGFVPYYIDGSSPSASVTDSIDLGSDNATIANIVSNENLYVGQAPSPETLALAELPQLGENSNSTPATETKINKTAGAPRTIHPIRISIPAADIDLPVQNPSTRNIDTLDALLNAGPARYVDSASLGTAGNVLIFAHSSHLPIVHNKMFQAFNNIPTLKSGDTITIKGDNGTSYLYSVTSVDKASIDDGTTINLSTAQGTKLTLVTCDTLTNKSARFVLHADYIGVVN